MKIKELNSFAVGGNFWELDKGCMLSLYNEDDQGNEIDTVSITLMPKQLTSLINMLSMFVKEKGE